MTQPHPTLALFCVAFSLLSGCRTSETEPVYADLVLLHGKIVTVDPARPEVQALAAQGELILAVGSDVEIERYIGPSTRVIDLDGKLAVPGLIEGHGHFMRYGQSLTELDLRGTLNWAEVVALVEEAAAQTAPGEWIVGGGWHQGKWDRTPEPNIEGLPLHGSLSAVSQQNPVMLRHASGHGLFANALAMEAAGIGPGTPNPIGGEIVRNPLGEAIGMLREDAAQPVHDALERFRAQRQSAVIEAERRNFIELACADAVAHGITSFQDMGSSFETIDLVKMVADEGGLPIRVSLAVEEPSSTMIERLADYLLIGYGNGYLTVRTVGEKVLDGALGTHGGWLLEPYTDLPRSSGFVVNPVEEIEASATIAAELGFQMAIQAIGDRAARVLLDIYEAVSAGRTDLRWRIEHAQVIHPKDVPRFAELGVIPSVQGLFACSDGPWVIDRLGPERARERGYLFRTLMDSGAVVTNGTDPPVEDIDPMMSFHCSVARRLPDGTLFFPEQRLTREQALRSYTINNAYALFEEDIKGTLTPGKLADITVLSRDIMTIPIDAIPTAVTVYTIVGGKVRYENDGIR